MMGRVTLKMRSLGVGRLVLIALVVILAWVPDHALMRESDQASLILGALEIGRSGGYISSEFYNYDKQYLSFWILAFIYRLCGLVAEGADLTQIVIVGNYCVKSAWAVGVIFLLCRIQWKSPYQGVVFLCGILSPTLVFSCGLLSSNVFSAAFMCGLVALLVRKDGATGDSFFKMALATILTYAAVACRLDAALVLPFVCLSRVSSWRELFTCKTNYLMGLAAVLAFVIGLLIQTGEPATFARFYDLRIMGAYFAFGLGGAILGLAMFTVLAIFSEISIESKLFRLALGFSVFLPLFYYLGSLYSPRHLMTSALILIFTSAMPSSVQVWQVLYRYCFGRGVACVLLLACVLPFFFGVQVTGNPNFKLSTWNSASHFPTADGHWSMGGYMGFLKKMSDASKRPIDHNQEMWACWVSADLSFLKAGDKFSVKGGGADYYGHLVCKVACKGSIKKNFRDKVNYSFVVDRSLLVDRKGVTGKESSKVERDRGLSRIMAQKFGRFIFLTGKGSQEAVDNNQNWHLKKRLALLFQGDDFRYFSKGSRAYLPPGHFGYLLSRENTSLEPAKIKGPSSLALGKDQVFGATVLPAFFSVKNF